MKTVMQGVERCPQRGGVKGTFEIVLAWPEL